MSSPPPETPAELERRLSQGLQSLYTIIPLSFAALGVQIFICWFGTIIYLETPKSVRSGRLGYIGVSWLILIFFTISQVGDAVETYNVLFHATSALEALSVWKPKYDSEWWRLTSSAFLFVNNWIGDGLMLYRCYIIWSDLRWIVVLPGVTYLAACVMSVVAYIALVQRNLADPLTHAEFIASKAALHLKSLQAWIFLSVSLNCLVTAFIAYRLLVTRKDLSGVMSKQDLRVYLGVIAILVESAVPLSVSGIAFAALTGATAKTAAVTIARTTALLCWFSLSAICPQLIIFRVTTGRSWVIAPSVRTSPQAFGLGNPADLTSTRMDFTNPLSETKTDPEISFAVSGEGESRRRHPIMTRVSEEVTR